MANYRRLDDPAGAGRPAPVSRYEPRDAPRTGPKHAAPHQASTRRIIGVLIGITVLAAGVLAATGVRPGSANPGPAAATATTSGFPTGPTAGTSGISAVGESFWTASSTLSGPLQRAGVPESGPGVTQPGIALIAWPAPDGTFDILERVNLPRPAGVLLLRPALVARAGNQFASSSATASQVQVSAGDQPVVVPRATVEALVSLPVPENTRFDVRYRLVGVTVRSTPSTAGRALAAIGPLTAGLGDDLPVHITVLGDSVLGLNCPLLPISEQACGTRLTQTPGLERELPARLAVAAVQFDVPPA